MSLFAAYAFVRRRAKIAPAQSAKVAKTYPPTESCITSHSLTNPPSSIMYIYSIVYIYILLPVPRGFWMSLASPYSETNRRYIAKPHLVVQANTSVLGLQW